MRSLVNNQSTALFCILLTFLLISFEMYIGYRYERKYYTTTDTRHNILLGVIFAGVEALLSGFCILFMSIILSHGLKAAPSNVYVYWISLFFIEDLLYYTMHYLDHHIRIL